MLLQVTSGFLHWRVQANFKGKVNPEQAKDLTKFYKPRNSQATENI